MDLLANHEIQYIRETDKSLTRFGPESLYWVEVLGNGPLNFGPPTVTLGVDAEWSKYDNDFLFESDIPYGKEHTWRWTS